MDIPRRETEEFLSQDDTEWLTVNAVRQAFSIARKAQVTYSDSIEIAQIIYPGLFRPESPLLSAFEKEVVKLYRERAEARSRLESVQISPLQLIDQDLRERTEEFEKALPEQRQAISSELNKLNRARIQIDTTSWTEDKAIHRDAEAIGQDLPVSGKGQGYKIYRVAGNRTLRVRIFHPDRAEHLTGVDLVYENYYNKVENNKSTLLVRIVVLQYKMWDGKAIYTAKATNLLDQMKKMEKSFCAHGFCDHPQTTDKDDRYRLPFCCAFLRPTDRKQTKDAWQITHAWHVPICRVFDRLEATNDGNFVIHSNMIRSNSLTQDTFHELYASNMLGSRFVGVDKLNALYEDIGIFKNVDKVILHAQEH